MKARIDGARVRWTPANLLTAFRLLVAAPMMLLLAVAGEREWFRWVLVASFFSDAIDGTVARLSGQATRFGAMLDSWADVTAYAVIAVSVFLLWPELVRIHWISCTAIVASFVSPGVAGLAKFGRFTSYHTWMVKLAVAATAAALLLLLWGGPAWPLPIAAATAVLAATEEMAMTWVLDEPVSDLRGYAAARRHARHARPRSA